jgi:hypothetical protein
MRDALLDRPEIQKFYVLEQRKKKPWVVGNEETP